MKRFKYHLKEMTKKALQQKIADLDDRLDTHSNAGRVMNTGKLSSQEFKKLLKKKVADSDVKIVPPSTGANKSSQFDLFSFEI